MKLDKDNVPDFSGKCISMSLVNSESSYDLDDPHFEYQCGKLVIVGVIPEGCSDSGWDVGQISAVDWSQVYSYVLFTSFEAYSKGIKISENYQEKNKVEET